MTQKIGQVIALSTLIFGSFIPTAFSATAPQEKVQETKSETLLAQSTVRKGNFKFQIQNCRRSNEKVICGVLVTNISDRNRIIYFYRTGTNAIDYSGNAYEGKLPVIAKYSDVLRFEMTPGIPTKVNYHFTIPQGINRLAGIEVSGSMRKIGFRNVPIGNYRRVRGRHNCQ
ncbi:MAG: hypothetical protein AAFR83_18465 [Cyanobacteria bacterium J06629_18]